MTDAPKECIHCGRPPRENDYCCQVCWISYMDIYMRISLGLQESPREETFSERSDRI